MSKKRLQSAKTIRDKKKAKDARREKRKERRRTGELPALPTWKRPAPPPGPSLAEILTGPLPPFPATGPAPDAYGLAALAMFAAAYGKKR